MELLPPINQKIKDIIDERFNGSVRAFCLKLGLKNSQKINRLFNIDPRNEKYPIPSTEILTLISNTLDVPIETLLPRNYYDQESPSAVAEPTTEYGAHKSDLRILIEQNAQLVKNNTKLVDTITRLSEELITLNREAKNGPARGDVKCADVG